MPAERAEGFILLRHTSAAALSAAVDSLNEQETAPTFRRNQVRRNAHLKRQPLFGRGGLGERRFSQRSGLSPSVPLCITLLNLLFSQSCPHVEKAGDFGFSTSWYSQAVERVKSGAKLENLGKKWGKSAEIFEKGKWKKEGIKRHGREYR